jgi:hypothetical protein
MQKGKDAYLCKIVNSAEQSKHQLLKKFHTGRCYPLTILRFVSTVILEKRSSTSTDIK